MKAVKAKDQYGYIIPIVEKKKRELAAQGLTLHGDQDDEHDGDGVPEKMSQAPPQAQPASNTLMPYA